MQWKMCRIVNVSYVLNLINCVTLRNCKVQGKKLKNFKTNIWKFYQNILGENGKEKLSPNNSSFLNNKKKKKCQSEYYPDNLNLISFCRRTPCTF